MLPQLFTEINPDKGTETMFQVVQNHHYIEFTEINPDKGTETLFV